MPFARASRRRFLTFAAPTAVLGLLAACQASPAPTAAPAKPTEAPKPAAAASVAAAPTAPAATSAPAAAAATAPTAGPAPGVAAALASTAPQSATGAAAKPGAAESCDGPKGGVLVFGRASDSEGFDPQAEGNGESIKVLSNLYNGLIKSAPGGGLVPDLASKWDVSGDGLTYNFALKPGVKFHDGTELDAAAVKFSFERAAMKDDPAYVASMAQAAGFTFASIKSVDAVDKLNVRISLKAPDTTFLNNLSTSAAFVVSPAAVKKSAKEFRQNPVGTGPFKFVRWVRNQDVQLERNPDYALAGCPPLDRLVFRVIPDNAVRLQELRTSAIHLADSLGPTEVQAIGSGQGMQLLTSAAPAISLVNFRLAKDPWKDARVRRAVNHAINKSELIKGLYGDLVKPAYGPVLPGLPGFDAQFQGPYPYDPAKAKALLAEAGFGGGIDATLWIQSLPRFYNPVGPRLAESLQSYLNAVGIRAKIVSREPAAFNQVINDKKNMEPDMYVTGWLSDNGAQHYFISSYYQSTGAYNTTGYANPQVDKLLDQALSTVDTEKATALYRDAQKAIVDDAAAVWIGNAVDTMGASSAVKGYELLPWGARHRFDKLYLQR